MIEYPSRCNSSNFTGTLALHHSQCNAASLLRFLWFDLITVPSRSNAATFDVLCGIRLIPCRHVRFGPRAGFSHWNEDTVELLALGLVKNGCVLATFRELVIEPLLSDSPPSSERVRFLDSDCSICFESDISLGPVVSMLCNSTLAPPSLRAARTCYGFNCVTRIRSAFSEDDGECGYQCRQLAQRH